MKKQGKKDFLSIKDLSKEEVAAVFKMARIFKRNPFCKRHALSEKSIALVFQKPSNRTRVSFEVGMVDLGGHAVYLSPEELKMGVRESIKDVAKTLSKYIDGMVARTFKHEDAISLAKYSSVPVINGLSDLLHPCQGMSDVFTIEEKFGNKKAKIAYVGDGNNVLHSLILGCSAVGRNISIATPPGYEPRPEIVEEAQRGDRPIEVELTHDPEKCVEKADVVYTDVWVSMGDESERNERLSAFNGFQVNKKLLSYAKRGVLVMHCLPAHRGEEITDEVIDSENSIVFDQAENRLHVQKAILLKLLG